MKNWNQIEPYGLKEKIRAVIKYHLLLKTEYILIPFDYGEWNQKVNVFWGVVKL
jgi:hypothetical protein